MPDDTVPEDERAEALDEEPEDREPHRKDRAEVPDADAAEQEEPLRSSTDQRPRIRDDVSELDALDQARSAAWDDEDEPR